MDNVPLNNNFVDFDLYNLINSIEVQKLIEDIGDSFQNVNNIKLAFQAIFVTGLMIGHTYDKHNKAIMLNPESNIQQEATLNELILGGPWIN